MSFDLLAPHYRWLEWVLAGGKLQRCRTAHIDVIPEPRQALLVGEGNGRLLCQLAARFPRTRFTCVDASAKMLRAAKNRLQLRGLGGTSVEFIHADILDWEPDGSFDLIVTHFFLDCFQPEQLARIVPRLAAAAAPGANWLVADFREPQSGWRKWRARLVLKSMYLFFQAVTRLPARSLASPDPLLKQSGFMLARRSIFEWGLLHSDLWLLDGSPLKRQVHDSRMAFSQGALAG